MKTATCLHIVALYDNTMSGLLFPGVIRMVSDLGFFDSRAACL
jgi:hypothetical protein